MAIENLPGPMKEYKSINQFEKSLIDWLEEKIN